MCLKSQIPLFFTRTHKLKTQDSSSLRDPAVYVTITGLAPSQQGAAKATLGTPVGNPGDSGDPERLCSWESQQTLPSGDMDLYN